MNNPFSRNSGDDHPVIKQRKKLSFAERAADTMTEAMGSWRFIIFFALLIATWLSLNLYGWRQQWDPYPFILLNLALSMISAFQAPIIMMSQNRQADRDRIAAKYDYAVNRKTEREVADMQKDLDEIKTMLATLTESHTTSTRK